MSLFRYTAPAYISRLVILSVDTLSAFISIHLASILRFNFDLSQGFFILSPIVLTILFIRLISFRWFKTYAVIVRFAGVSDILQVFYAVTGGSLFIAGLAILLRPYGLNISISVLLIDYFLLLSMMGALRLIMNPLYQYLWGRKIDKTNVMIIGAGNLGAIATNLIKQDIKAGYNVHCIVDDNPDLENKSLDGIPIISVNKIKQITSEVTIDKAIFAIQNISQKRKNEIVDECLLHGIKVLQVPITSSWMDQELKLNQLKEIQIEDLLNRPVIALDDANLRKEYADKSIMITGGAGSIGSEIIRQLLIYNPKQIIIIDQAETPLVNIDLECREEFNFDGIIPVIADVTDTPRMLKIFEQFQPNIIFHAAAYKHVPIMETYPREALHVNVKGTKNLAILADTYEVEKFVMVSTDKAVNPTNIMGATKRIAEIFIQSFNATSKTKFITTRFGNVLGSNGSVVPRFKKQIAKGGPITVTHKDITRYFMTIPEASLLVLEAGAMGSGGEIYLFDMGEPVKISDLAIKMIQLSGLQPNEDISITYTGLRPGEKLYEELLTTTENSIETHHPKITKARVRDHDFELIEKSVSNLISKLDTTDTFALVKLMKQMVPEFKSNNSVFKKLDAQISMKKEGS